VGKHGQEVLAGRQIERETKGRGNERERGMGQRNNRMKKLKG
jgi:hypothetical protein